MIWSPALLMTVAFCLCAADVPNDDAFKEASSLLSDARLDRLERHLTVQQRDLFQLSARLIAVEAEKDACSAELHTQKAQLLTQKAELQTKTTKLQTLKAELQRQQIEQQTQNAELQTQKAELLTQKAALQTQSTELQKQKTELQAQKADLQIQNTELQTQKAELQTALTARENPVPKANSSDTTSGSRPKGPSLVTSSPHRDVMARSDDGGPLEAVVLQMGQRLTTLQADVEALQNSDRQQNEGLQDALSSTFVRWGNSGCGDGNASDLVYSGVVGGSFYAHTGAATNYLCLTMAPVVSDHSVPGGNYVAFLYGGEYDTKDWRQDSDPVCAVCRSRFTNTIMIPGTNVCSPGWRAEYSGFLMAGRHDNQAGSEYICVDTKLETRPGSGDDHNGKLLFFTATSCGSLPCGPYVNDKIVTCVVCSK